MKATEVLRRYAAGERDFRGADLRGQSFKGRDLSGADLSETDIRGANFTHANLSGANFAKAKAGLQWHWMIGQLILSFGLAALAGILLGYASNLTAFSLLDSKYPSAMGLLLLIFLIVLAVVIIRHGFVVETFGTLAITLSIAFAVTFWLLLTADRVVAGAFALVVIGMVAGMIAIAFATAFAGGLLGAIALPFVGGFAVAVVGVISAKAAFLNLTPMMLALALLLAVVIGLLGVFMAWCALQRNSKYVLLRKLSVAFNAIGGTAFCGATLTHANFSQAALRSTNFNSTRQRQTVLDWVCWQAAKQLDRARVGSSALANLAVCDLLVTGNGYKKSYADANLRACILDGANLEEADLTWADFSCSSVRAANLKNAILREALVLNTDFTGSFFTGACLEDWNMDSYTNLDQVDCQYVYLLRDQKERRPSSGDFAPGEFTKLFQEVISTVDLIFRNGIDWKAFTYSFNKLVLDNEGTELSIQSIENKGDGVVVVRVNAPPDADKGRLHGEFNQTYEAAVKALEAKYQAELKAKDEQITIYRQQSADMLEITRLMANRPINVQAYAEAKSMNNSSDQSRTTNFTGNINATNSVVNLGEISGNVSNTIQQLQQSPQPESVQLAAWLKELQTAIETEPNLPEPDKAEALEQIGTLAKAGENPQDGTLKKLSSTSVKILKGTIASLPDAAKLAEACAKLLPLITKVLGI
ncbi:MAG TPA: pentapeptide repeat-containing protein [Leptolyngbyaceae cyanobacterium M33_DOE_097]|uniref:Pentapeptide repeat-containing protein n=1 Tax=Oscillatoriales cyanobacterium SpSt-418 TaxID=2282169 RepID=A0A7C3PH84_9CYAN|nr:pentapeptide repeat-containing protein [Leptolyngbyaceae cyanobacterium M33_DOE_097]